MNGIPTSNVASMIVQKSPAEDYYDFLHPFTVSTIRQWVEKQNEIHKYT